MFIHILLQEESIIEKLLFNTCKLITSSLVAGVAETDCRHNCPFDSHSSGGRIESRISSVSVFAFVASLSILTELLGRILDSSDVPDLPPFLVCDNVGSLKFCDWNQ